MHIDVIDTMPSLLRIEPDWNAAYAADPEASVFLSWKWMRDWLSLIPGPWFILAAKASDGERAPYVAFFPLRLQSVVDDDDVRTELRMAGNFGADYTGIVCPADIEHRVIPAFGRYIRQMHWARMHLENVRMSESRFRLLTAYLPRHLFRFVDVDRTDKVDGIDHSLCPFASLPALWEGYLESLSANTRQKLRRLLKLIDNPGEYRVTVATPETFERDLRALLKFWEIKWRPRKGDNIDALVQSNGAMLTRCFQSGMVFLPTFWHGDRPVAALATLVDERKRTFAFYMTGRDEGFDGPPAGTILHAFSIRHAIANGFLEYDFLRGNEAYKYSLGSTDRKVRCVTVETRTGKNLGGRIDPRIIPDILEQATALHKKGQSTQAETGYRTILANQPGHADALHRLGQLLAAKGDFAAAKPLFCRLTAIRPEAAKAWLCMGQVCEGLGQHHEAIHHYFEFMRLQPEQPEGFVGMSRCLVKLGRMAEVNAALMAAIGPATRPPARSRREAAPATSHRSAPGQSISL